MKKINHCKLKLNIIKFSNFQIVLYQSFKGIPLPSLNEPAKILIQSTSTHIPLAIVQVTIQIRIRIPHTIPATLAEAFSLSDVTPAIHKAHEPKIKNRPV